MTQVDVAFFDIWLLFHFGKLICVIGGLVLCINLSDDMIAFSTFKAVLVIDSYRNKLKLIELINEEKRECVWYMCCQYHREIFLTVRVMYVMFEHGCQK